MYIPLSIHRSTNHNSSLINNQWVIIHEHQVSSKQNHSNKFSFVPSPSLLLSPFSHWGSPSRTKKTEAYIMPEEIQTSWSLSPEEGRQMGNTWEVGTLTLALIFTFGESLTSFLSSSTARSLILFLNLNFFLGLDFFGNLLSTLSFYRLLLGAHSKCSGRK